MRLALIGLLLCASIADAQSLEDRYQTDAGHKRVADVVRIVDLIAEYRDQTGMLPFAEDYTEGDMLHVVAIGTEAAQQRDREIGSPFGISMRKYPALELLDKLEIALDRDLTLPVDPQKVPVHAPNLYYLFLLENNEFGVLTFLYHPHDQAVEVAPNVNIYAIASTSGFPMLSGLNLNWQDRSAIPDTNIQQILTLGDQADATFARTTDVLIDNELQNSPE